MAQYQIVVLVMMASAVQFALLGFSLLLEFSDRKRNPRPIPARRRPKLGSAATAVPSAPIGFAPLPSPGPPPVAQPAPPESHPAETAAEPETTPVPVTGGAVEQSALSAAGAEATAVEPPEPGAQAQTGTADGQAPVSEPVAKVSEPVRIGLGLRKTREGFLARLRAAIGGSARLDEIYDGLEEALIAADVGVDASTKLVKAVRDSLKHDAQPDTIRAALKNEIERILTAVERPMAEPPADEPLVIMLAGVNGAGKTTTIAKLAALLKAERGPVTVAAADTFRAAAIDQLEVWCKRAGAGIIKQKQGSDPAAVAFDAVKAARARRAKVVLIDTAGRLQTKVNLMEELRKIVRVVGRELAGAPHETWLVLDATTGQNALSQARIFGEAVALTGVVLAKLDSTAKGGVVIGIAAQLQLPVRYVGLGESIEDLRVFDAREFVEALFEGDELARQSASGSYAA